MALIKVFESRDNHWHTAVKYDQVFKRKVKFCGLTMRDEINTVKHSFEATARKRIEQSEREMGKLDALEDKQTGFRIGS